MELDCENFVVGKLVLVLFCYGVLISLADFSSDHSIIGSDFAEFR